MKEGRECPVSPNPFGRGPGHPAGITVTRGSNTHRAHSAWALPTCVRHLFLTRSSLHPCEVGAMIFSVSKEENAEAQRGSVTSPGSHSSKEVEPQPISPCVSVN